MIDRWCLPIVVAHNDVPAEAVRMVHKSLGLLPRAACTALWTKKHGVFLRRDFDSLGATADPYTGGAWSDHGGYWDGDSGYAVINAAWCHSQARMDGVVVHEFGHALSIDVLPRPHRSDAFRAAWRRGCAILRERYPADVAACVRMGIYALHWTQGVQEVWADAFAWLLDARGTIDPAFGVIFADCIALVEAEVSAL